MSAKVISLSVIVFAIIALGSITDTPGYTSSITTDPNLVKLESPVLPMNVEIVEWPHPLNLAGTFNYSVTLNGEHVPMSQDHIEAIVKAYNIHLVDITHHSSRVRMVVP